MFHLERQLIDEERISVIPNFLSANECQQLIERAEESGFKLSPPSGKITIHIATLFYIEELRWFIIKTKYICS
jgi:hypothetical protein